MSRFVLRATAFALLLALAACASSSQRNPRDAILYEYVGVIRWSDFDRAIGFIEPQALAANPIEPIELERLKQYQVTGYEVRTSSEPMPGQYLQVVQIRMVNKHTQAQKMLLDHQTWIWDEETSRWWLTSGLPNLDNLQSE